MEPLERDLPHQTTHVPVLLHEVITALHIREDDVVLDGTLGGGGHAQAILAQLGHAGRYIGIDANAAALVRARARLGDDPRVVLAEGNFRDAVRIVRGAGCTRVSKILLDLGLSSDELDTEGRGFSFMRDEPLGMTFAQHPGPDALTAHIVVNEWEESSLCDILYGFGGEQQARKVARAIVAARSEEPIETTGRLAEIIERVLPKRGPAHPATKTFQAIRIAVNDELGALERVLEEGIGLLAPGGRFVVITFHSLEDRIVKRHFRSYEDAGVGVRVFKRPLVPSREEVAQNRRARSAKLRCFEKNPAVP